MNNLKTVVLTVGLGFTLLLMASCSPPEQNKEQQPSTDVLDATKPNATAANELSMPDGLPQLQACQDTSVPALPAKWTSSALMQTFGENDIVVGKFTYDDSEQAYRFSLAFAGSSNFSDYLLTADNRLYALQGSYEQPSSCSYSLMLQMDLPARNLMSSAAQCVGEGEINQVNRQWWKDTAEGGVGANWYWFTADDDRGLFRMMPYKGVDNLGWPGNYAFTYFSEFNAQQKTNIGQLKELCGVADQDSHAVGEELLDMATALQKLLPTAEQAPLANTENSFMPEVQQCESSTQRPPEWPATLRATTLLTAVNVNYSPFPSLVRYDASKPGLRTDMYNPWPPTSTQWDLYSARLVQDKGYSVYFKGDEYKSCTQDLPGPPLPNWMNVDGCECKASLPVNSSLNPRSDESLLVMMCPLTPASADPKNPQVFWTWYGQQSGSPLVFMQSDSSAKAGTGLNLADYYSWEPNATIDPEIFSHPDTCMLPKPDPGQNKAASGLPHQCHNCHLPLNSEYKSGKAAQWHVPIK
jgi:hypothetical protein